MDSISKKDRVIIKLNKHLDIASIQELFLILKKALDTQQPILLQANEITRIDTACLQMLLSFYLACQEKKMTVEWESPSSIFIEIAKILNMNQLLKLS